MYNVQVYLTNTRSHIVTYAFVVSICSFERVLPDILFALIHWFIHSSMALQPFVGPWPLLQFRNHFYTDGSTPWTSDRPVGRSLPKHRINAYTNIHAFSEIRTHDPNIRASDGSSCFRPRGHHDLPCPFSLQINFLRRWYYATEQWLAPGLLTPYQRWNIGCWCLVTGCWWEYIIIRNRK
jgi:hypothetical protein